MAQPHRLATPPVPSFFCLFVLRRTLRYRMTYLQSQAAKIKDGNELPGDKSTPSRTPVVGTATSNRVKGLDWVALVVSDSLLHFLKPQSVTLPLPLCVALAPEDVLHHLAASDCQDGK